MLLPAGWLNVCSPQTPAWFVGEESSEVLEGDSDRLCVERQNVDIYLWGVIFLFFFFASSLSFTHISMPFSMRCCRSMHPVSSSYWANYLYLAMKQLFLVDAPHMNAAFSKSGPEGLYENFVSAVFPLSPIYHPQLYLHWESNDLNPDVCNVDNKTEGCLCLRKTGIYLFFNIYVSSYSYNSHTTPVTLKWEVCSLLKRIAALPLGTSAKHCKSFMSLLIL